jgi:23S rRNA pseudouridine1911/1915/1917 synthase
LEKLFDIIFEDADLLVVHKPAGLVCHPTKGDEFSSLISRARIYLNSKISRDDHEVSVLLDREKLKIKNSKLKTLEPHLINRLDRETSGIVLIAKNSVAAGELGKIWESRAVQKEYLAIVHGHVAAEHGIIDAPLGKDEHSRVAIKDCVRPDGASAQTEFFVEKRFARNMPCADSELKIQNSKLKIKIQPFSLLRLFPRTGRKHQIRIHLAHIGHPIVGDKLYGGDEDLYLALVQNRLTDAQRAQLRLPNQALHASRLQFVWRGKKHDYFTPPEADFQKFVQQ